MYTLLNATMMLETLLFYTLYIKRCFSARKFILLLLFWKQRYSIILYYFKPQHAIAIVKYNYTAMQASKELHATAKRIYTLKNCNASKCSLL